MPEKIKKKLKKYAKKKFPGDKEKQNSYIYGTLNKIENMARGGVLKEVKLPEQKLREGGVLKPIPEGNKGLPNLPKKVRNKMGYMQEGGKVVKYKSISELEENMAEGGEMPAIGDKYKRRRKRKARRQRRGKKQRGSCYNIGGETICPGDKGYNPNLVIALQGMEIPKAQDGLSVPVRGSESYLVEPIKSKEKKPLKVHQFLDYIGVIPVAGEFADAANALLYMGRGDDKNAALSIASMVPFLGAAKPKVVKDVKKGIKKIKQKLIKPKAQLEAELKIMREYRNKLEKTVSKFSDDLTGKYANEKRTELIKINDKIADFEKAAGYTDELSKSMRNVSSANTPYGEGFKSKTDYK